MNKCICNGLKEEDLKSLAHGDYTELYIGKERGEYWLKAVGEGEAYKRIKYCPLCGRKLAED